MVFIAFLDDFGWQSRILNLTPCTITSAYPRPYPHPRESHLYVAAIHWTT